MLGDRHPGDTTFDAERRFSVSEQALAGGECKKMKKSSVSPSSLVKLGRNRFRQEGVRSLFEETSKIVAVDPKVPGTADVNDSDTGTGNFEETSKNFKMTLKFQKSLT